MDRRTFIQRLLAGGATLGAGLTLASVFNESKAVTVQLPALREHVRHGLFSPENADSLWPGPKWIQQLQRDRFFADGISPSPHDLFFSNLQLGEQPVGLSLQGNQVTCSVGDRHLTNNLVTDKLVRCLREEPYRVHALRTYRGVTIPEASLGREVFAFSIYGSASVGSQSIHTDQALYFKAPREISIRGEEGALLILVSKT